MRKFLLFLTGCIVASALHAQSAPAIGWVERRVSIPAIGAGANGLDSLIVYVSTPGKHPLVIMTHGTSREEEQRRELTPWGMLPQAVWFARRGFVVVTVVRKGYGVSGGDPDTKYGHCPQTDYERAGDASAEDLRTAADYMRQLPYVDGDKIISIGVSTGGFASVALSAYPPKGLVAGISFAGGRGSTGPDTVCDPSDLVGAFKFYGKKSHVPMLWIYSENDHYFSPALAHKFDEAYHAGGGQDQLVMVPPFREDGHAFFGGAMQQWSPLVEDFLKAHDLLPLSEPLPAPPVPDIAAPAGLSESGQRAFHSYLELGPNKAFAFSSDGHLGYSAAQLNKQLAVEKAMENCHKVEKKADCKVAFINNEAVK